MKKEKIKCDIAFVILQYGNEKDTENCINSIEQRLEGTKYKIVAVDNCSKDTSADMLEKFCTNRNNVVVLKNDRNLGFAQGNNVGIDYVKEQYKPDFIAVINNDIELLTDHLYECLTEDFCKYKFAVWGPMILSGDGKYTSNPMALELFNEAGIEREIKHSKRMILINRLHLFSAYSILKKKAESSSIEEIKNRFDYLQDIKLHGCFLVFSKIYFENYAGFDPSTFLYMEEDILQLRLKQRGLKSLYCPSYLAFHKEGATSKKLIKNNNKRMEFVFTNRLKSQNIYKKILLNEE